MFEKIHFNHVKTLALLGASAITMAGISGVAHAAPSIERSASVLNVGMHHALTVDLKKPVASVYITDAKIASYQVVNNRKIIIFGISPGETSFIALDKNGNNVFSSALRVSFDLKPVRHALRESYPEFDIKLMPVHNGIVVRGEVPTASDAANVIGLINSLFKPVHDKSGSDPAGAAGGGGDEESSGAAQGQGAVGERIGSVINQLTVTTPNQVTVRVRIAEVNRKLTDRLGVSWGAGYKGRNIVGKTDSLGAFLKPEFWTPEGVAGGTVAHFMGETMIDALARESLVSILAEPNLTVLSGETANFIAGGEIPFVSYKSEEPSIDFREYGIILSVTPTILSGNRISLRLRPEVSEPSHLNGIAFNGMSQPGFIVRRAESTVELASGQSFAIAGLLKNDFANTVSKIPGIGDIPVLGALARSKEFERGETELVIVATAFISTPSGKPYIMPNEHTEIPSVWSRFFLNANPSTGTKPTLPKPLDYIF